MYDNAGDLEFRLLGTVVWYNGNYAYVDGTRKEDNKERLTLLQGGEVVRVFIGDPLLKVKNIPTGFVDCRGTVRYFSRLANRTYRQGLRSDCVSNVKCLEVIKAWCRVGGEEVKFLSRDFADIDNTLFYRGKPVGLVLDNKPMLMNAYQFLKEALEVQYGHQ